MKKLMNEFLYRSKMRTKDFAGIFLNNFTNTTMQKKSSPVSNQNSYSSILSQLLQKNSVNVPEIPAGRTLTYSESLAAAKSIYHTFDEDKLAACQKQINLGAAIQDNIDRDSMSMTDYKLYISAKIKSIPMDYTHQDDTEIINISEDGWNRMKSDENYEAWILGYLRQDFAFHNPWYGVGSVRGSFVVENFGASVNEHHGTGQAKIDPAEAAKQASEATERRRKKKKLLQELEEEKYLQQRQIAEANARIAEMKSLNGFVDLSQIEMPAMISADFIVAVTV